ncbi:phosphoenolpyruvate mutase [Lacunisphaera limnophila]|nr:phosphoenolpyruvate mutase [Lacunisphaera limnophila]
MKTDSPPTKAQMLRALLTTTRLDFIMEAHNGLSARIAEEAGFPAIWASGLAISASLGVRDNNEASWTQVVEVAEFMADATQVPILFDGDTGFGNFNNFRRLVRKLEQRGIAGVCLEDKIFPKANSFQRGPSQLLAPVDDFCGKIKAGKDAQYDESFVLIARTEALIAGCGLAEAIRRAEAYRQAGADAIIVHSAHASPDEIFAFLDRWENRHPIILIPTKYHTTPTQHFARRRVAALIWANHLLRSSIAAMQSTAVRIVRERSVSRIEPKIASLNEVFRLQGDEELRVAEGRFGDGAAQRKAILLVGTRDKSIRHLPSQKLSQAMVCVDGISIVERMCNTLSTLNVRDITIVAGSRVEAISRAAVRIVGQRVWNTSGDVGALKQAADLLQGTCVIALADVLCRRYILQQMLEDPADFVIAADRSIRRHAGRPRCLLKLANPAPHVFIDADVVLRSAAFSDAFSRFDAEWLGLLKCSARGAETLRNLVGRLNIKTTERPHSLLDALLALQNSGERIKVILVSSDWTTADSAVGLKATHQS